MQKSSPQSLACCRKSFGEGDLFPIAKNSLWKVRSSGGLYCICGGWQPARDDGERRPIEVDVEGGVFLLGWVTWTVELAPWFTLTTHFYNFFCRRFASPCRQVQIPGTDQLDRM